MDSLCYKKVQFAEDGIHLKIIINSSPYFYRMLSLGFIFTLKDLKRQYS